MIKITCSGKWGQDVFLVCCKKMAFRCSLQNRLIHKKSRNPQAALVPLEILRESLDFLFTLRYNKNENRDRL